MPCMDVAVKAAVLLAVGALAELLWRRASASARHLLWTSVLAGALAVALVSPVAPRWRMEAAAIDAAPVVGLFRAGSVPNAAEIPAAPETAPAPRANPAIPWSALAAWLWAAGAALVVTRMTAGAWAVRRIVRRAMPAPETIAARVRARAEVLLASGPLMPMTCGVFRPRILLPADARNWPAERLDAVLLHELAHVRRRDTLWQAVADLACALHWPNPLAWYGRRRALVWRERAADDFVLASGARPSDYAANLLEIARSLSVPRLCGSAAMARRSQVEGRLLAILDARANRGDISRRLAGAVAGAALAAALGLATWEPLAAQVPPLEREAEAALAEFDFDRALARYRDMLVETERRHSANSPELARLWVKIAAAAAPLDGRTAEQALERAAAIFADAGVDDPAYAEALYRLGVYTPRDRAGFYNRALEVARRSGADAIAARVLHNLAILDPAMAEQHLREAIEIETRLDRPALLACSLEALARVYRNSGRDAEAEDAAGRARLARQRAASQTAAPPPLPGGTYRVGGGVSPPRLVSKVEPVFSSEARAAKLDGMVALWVVIGPDGVPGDVRVIRPLGLGLDEQAVLAVRQWRFEPGTRDGQPVSVAATVEMNFRLF